MKVITALFAVVALVSAAELAQPVADSQHNVVRRHHANNVHHQRGVQQHSGAGRKRGLKTKKDFCKARKAQQSQASVSSVSSVSKTSTAAAAEKTKNNDNNNNDNNNNDNNNNDSGSGGGGGDHTGDATFYATGLNACGTVDQDSDFIAAAAHSFFDNFPGATGNPNNNPICNKKLTAHWQGHSVTVRITDRCGGCEINGSLDFSPSAFSKLTGGQMGLGRVHGMTWSFD